MFGRRGAETTPQTQTPPPVTSKPEARPPAPAAKPQAASSPSKKSGEDLLLGATDASLKTPDGPKVVDELSATKDKIYGLLMEQIDIATSSRLPREELKRQIIELIGEIVMEQKLPLNQT